MVVVVPAGDIMVSTKGMVEPTGGVVMSVGGVVATAEDKLLVEDGVKLLTAGGVTPLVDPDLLDMIHNTVTV